MSIRIGIGYDVHALAEGYDFWLGGIRVEHTKGAIAHSDGDALIHAICDALLGAAALRDIGYHFPDTDPALKGVDSKVLLAKTADIVSAAGYSIGNIDAIVSLQRPKIKDYIPQMQKTIEGVLNLQPGSVSVKATTTEKLGFVGREEGVAVQAIALIVRKI
jgi:2-C-methyl-D-erythritol 2,4-cyclodiphosphate synthase